jgi:hypothetical protein
LFTLDWLQNIELRRRVHVGLNKGEAKNALAKAVFFNRLGEMRESQFREPALPGQRPQLGGGRHHPLEHSLLGTRDSNPMRLGWRSKYLKLNGLRNNNFTRSFAIHNSVHYLSPINADNQEGLEDPSVPLAVNAGVCVRVFATSSFHTLCFFFFFSPACEKEIV